MDARRALGSLANTFSIPTVGNINPRTDGGQGHLSTDGGADNRPPDISKTKQARDTR